MRIYKFSKAKYNFSKKNPLRKQKSHSQIFEHTHLSYTLVLPTTHLTLLKKLGTKLLLKQSATLSGGTLSGWPPSPTSASTSSPSLSSPESFSTHSPFSDFFTNDSTSKLSSDIFLCCSTCQTCEFSCRCHQFGLYHLEICNSSLKWELLRRIMGKFEPRPAIRVYELFWFLLYPCLIIEWERRL